MASDHQDLKLGMFEHFRYPSPNRTKPAQLDGCRNFFSVTVAPDETLTKIDRGIASIAAVKSHGELRTPAILIRSSPHKIGSSETPWQDVFDTDHGHIRYYGDCKTPGVDPTTCDGNKALLRARLPHASQVVAERKSAIPLVFFLGRGKGRVEFQGFGVIERAEYVTQLDTKSGKTFSNLVYDFAVLNIFAENETFDWSWINDRRDPLKTLEDTLEFAPKAWCEFLASGHAALPRLRRRVSSLMTTSRELQRPKPQSRENSVLKEIYSFYRQPKMRSRFEALAEMVAEHVLLGEGANYQRGWITPATSDGGADFIGRFDLGTGFGTASLVVLGQAKCEDPSKATSGTHIARTVARLRRGWVGVYVTTSFFSEAVQREIIEDAYPILLINGLRVAKVVDQLRHDAGFAEVQQWLVAVDETYEGRVKSRRPEEILLE